MSKKILISLMMIFGLSAVALAQKVYTPTKGSTERTAILNALRVPVEKELKQKIQFTTNIFNSNGTWAFIGGEPQSESGGKPNYKGTEYEDSIGADNADNNIYALLKKTKGKWTVVKYLIGCSDACYEGWWTEYKAPKSVFKGI